jgi:ribonuclease BN (tRNA processing enzyme)
VRVRVIGSSPAWPNPDGAHAGYLVEADGSRVLLDCGPGVLSRLRELEPWPTLDAIVISHFHLDHFGDLVPWVWGTMYRPERSRPQLWVPPGGVQVLSDHGSRLGFASMFAETFRLAEYPSGERFQAGGLSVLGLPMVHYRILCHGLRVESEGRSLAYSADTGPTPVLVELARDADLFLCEATLDTGADDGDLRGHLSAEEALDAAREARARRVILTHRPSELRVPEGVELAYDGLELEV